ncbi:ribonuclease HII [Nocardioides gilvus]|uniref:ribonuclease HII n=1 Tax=Nocardioides gilvus TaxID=1735589 RepID=UPI001EF720FE|nr:ribonuclease HII [Nocardioides gilvus]
MAPSNRPTLRLERSLLRDGITHLACADEVGRGALCGPVTIGMVVITLETRSAPVGVKDSKLLSPALRETLAPKVRRWATSYAVGHASAEEIDAHGIIAALRMAGHRALAGLSVAPDLVLLDGNHDYLSRPDQQLLFDTVPDLLDEVPRVLTAVKGDMRCAAVAAASILAKTERDAMMVRFAEQHPEYGWRENKGYAAPEHVDALRRLGPSPLHRRSWSLPGVERNAPVDVFATSVADGQLGSAMSLPAEENA